MEKRKISSIIIFLIIIQLSIVSGSTASYIRNGIPNQGIGDKISGSCIHGPAGDSPPYGEDAGAHWKYSKLRGIDFWEYARARKGGYSYHRLKLDYRHGLDDLQDDGELGIGGDRWFGILQDSSEWGGKCQPIQIGRKVRTIFMADVFVGKIDGSDFKYPVDPSEPNDMHFGRVALSSHPNLQTASGGPMTVDFDWWQTTETKDLADRIWWFVDANYYNEYSPKFNPNGVLVMPIEGMREDPEGMATDGWVPICIDLSWAYERMFEYYSDKIKDGSAYNYLNPPELWRIFLPIEGVNLKVEGGLKNIKIEDWNCALGQGDRAKYYQYFNSWCFKSYPFYAHLDYIDSLHD
jgi:hypothetical protein